jgi:hypothetical protein
MKSVIFPKIENSESSVDRVVSHLLAAFHATCVYAVVTATPRAASFTRNANIIPIAVLIC